MVMAASVRHTLEGFLEIQLRLLASIDTEPSVFPASQFAGLGYFERRAKAKEVEQRRLLALDMSKRVAANCALLHQFICGRPRPDGREVTADQLIAECRTILWTKFRHEREVAVKHNVAGLLEFLQQCRAPDAAAAPPVAASA